MTYEPAEKRDLSWIWHLAAQPTCKRVSDMMQYVSRRSKFGCEIELPHNAAHLLCSKYLAKTRVHQGSICNQSVSNQFLSSSIDQFERLFALFLNFIGFLAIRKLL